jgi:hypothetical protein
MTKPYRLHELNDEEFEELVGKLCMEVLGTGTIVFTKGKDGGRDGKFRGKANKFPSKTSPISGNFIIQAKHTTNPAASCSDYEFETSIMENKELPRIKNLVKSGELEYYIVFTNRRLTGGKEHKITNAIKKVDGVKDSWIIADDQIDSYLDLNPNVWKSMGFDKFSNPLRINPTDIGEVIIGFYEGRSEAISQFDSAKNFTYPGMKIKNAVNGLSEEYYNYIKKDSMPYFNDIKKFLENPRNKTLREQYHSTADEIKAKLIQKRGSFNTFDDVLTHMYDLIVDDNPHLKHRRRLAHVFLHYMYCDCDIGKHD